MCKLDEYLFDKYNELLWYDWSITLEVGKIIFSRQGSESVVINHVGRFDTKTLLDAMIQFEKLVGLNHE